MTEFIGIALNAIEIYLTLIENNVVHVNDLDLEDFSKIW